MRFLKRTTGSLFLLALALGACQQAPAKLEDPSPQAAVSLAAPDRTVTPEELAGLDGAALDRLLGPPSVIRREASAEIWQYQGRACVIDLFLYPDASAGSNRLLHLEARSSKDARPITAEVCLAKLSGPTGKLTARAR